MADGVRSTQAFTEVLVQPAPVADLRVSQSFVSVLISHDPVSLRPWVTQSFVEVLCSKAALASKTTGRRNIIIS